MGKRRSHHMRLGLFLGVGLVAALIAFAALAGGILSSQEQSTVDVRFSIRGSHSTPKDIVLVGIDGTTFSDLNTRWPFPRRWHARVIDRLHQAGARVIAYDIQFTGQTDVRDDNALVRATGRAGNLVFAATAVDAQGQTLVLGGEATLRRYHAVAGSAMVPSDAGGVVRRVPYSVDGLKSFSIRAAERASGRTIPSSALGGSSAWIDYVGPPGTVRSVPFSRVLRGKFDPRLFRGKIVVVGPVDAPVFQDVHPTSVGGGELMAGPEIQANEISTALRGFPLKDAPWGLNALLIVLLAFVPPLASMRFSPFRAFGLAVAVGLAYAVAVQVAFDHGRVLGFVYPLVALVVSAVGVVAVGSVLEAYERERIRDLFGRFVPEQVVDEVLAKTSDGLHLGGTLRVCTMMFTDLRGFTTFSESRSAEDVIHILNYYFGEISQAVLDHRGTLVSYLGDGLMAVFGAPLEQEDHADRAVAASREILLERLPRVNEWLREQGYGDGFRMGIGLNSGAIMSGNIGSERRMEYTTIGDTVNTASRLEGLTKGTPYPLFISQTTRELLREEPADLTYVDELEVRGRSEKVKVWSLEALAEPPAPPKPEPEPEPGIVAAAPVA
jgi:adenylate cyclase